MTEYELTQEADRGPIVPAPWGVPWKAHLLAMVGYLTIAAIAAWVTWYNLTLLHRFNPGYGRSLETERVFCRELDRRFISTRYEFDESDLICKVIEAEVNANAHR